MSDARLFPGWDTMLWMCPPVLGDEWGSTTPGFIAEGLRVWRPPESLAEQCREYSEHVDGPILEAIDGEIVAEWWRGGRFAVREAYP